MVAAVSDLGKAHRAGVKVGDVLVSIDGDRASQSAVEVQARLVALVVLVFLRFMGKLQAEVRMKCPETTCGFSSHAVAPCGTEDSVAVVDEVCFNPLTPASAIIHQRCSLSDDGESRMTSSALSCQSMSLPTTSCDLQSREWRDARTLVLHAAFVRFQSRSQSSFNFTAP